MRLGDVTGEIPRRSMTVARGTLKWEETPSDVELQRANLEAAALLGAKQAATILPELHPVPLTDAFLDVEHTEKELRATFTVQAVARQALDGYAIVGLQCALAVALDLWGGVIGDLHVVQTHA